MQGLIPHRQHWSMVKWNQLLGEEEQSLKLALRQLWLWSASDLIFLVLEPLLNTYLTLLVWAWWLSGKFGALRPEGRRLESRSSRHVETLGKWFTHSCL